MKKSIIGKIIIIIMIIAATIEIGITIACYMLTNIDIDKYQVDYNIQRVKMSMICSTI